MIHFYLDSTSLSVIERAISNDFVRRNLKQRELMDNFDLWKMKLVFVANRIPYPPFRGDKLKIFNLAKCLSPDHELHLITFYETAQELTYEKELKNIITQCFFNPSIFIQKGINAKSYYQSNTTIKQMTKGFEKAINFVLELD